MVEIGTRKLDTGRSSCQLVPDSGNNTSMDYHPINEVGDGEKGEGGGGENLRRLKQFVKKYSSYIYLLNQGRSIFKKELIYKGRCGIRFCYLFWFWSRNIIFFSSQTQFSKRIIGDC